MAHFSHNPESRHGPCCLYGASFDYASFRQRRKDRDLTQTNPGQTQVLEEVLSRVRASLLAVLGMVNGN
jgi:hypothetical protein